MRQAVWEITREMFLSEPETDRLLSELRSRIEECQGRERLRAQTDRIIVESLLYSGLRNSEFCQLQLNDTAVCLGESAFDVRTSRPPRRVSVPGHVSELIKDYARDVRPQFLGDQADPQDPKQPLVVNERGNAYDRTALYRRVVKILSAAGLAERASVQLLRHTYGYLAYKRTGGNLLFVQRQLGHAHPMVTAVYAQFVDESYAELANAIPVSKMSTRGRSRRQDGTRRRS